MKPFSAGADWKKNEGGKRVAAAERTAETFPFFAVSFLPEKLEIRRRMCYIIYNITNVQTKVFTMSDEVVDVQKKDAAEYSASKITVLEGLEAVRMRPAM